MDDNVSLPISDFNKPYQLIVRTSNHVLYVNNVSRLARQDFFHLARANREKV